MHRWHDGWVNVRHLVAALIVSVSLAASGTGPGLGRPGASAAYPVAVSSATPSSPEGDDAATVGTNPFIPEDPNIGDCVSSLPRPGCGAEASTSAKTALTFAVLMLAMAFIGWRIARGVRQRDSSASRSGENP